MNGLSDKKKSPVFISRLTSLVHRNKGLPTQSYNLSVTILHSTTALANLIQVKKNNENFNFISI